MILGRPLFFPLLDVIPFAMRYFKASVLFIWRETTSGMYVSTLSVLLSEISSSVQERLLRDVLSVEFEKEEEDSMMKQMN